MVIPVEPRPRPPRPGGPSGLLAMLVVLALAVGIWLLAGRDPGTSTGGPEPDPGAPTTAGLPVVDVDALPPEAARVVDAVEAGEPAVPGRVFADDDGDLPDRDPGYYLAYTVPSPPDGLVVAGEQGELYWSTDAGVTFSAVAP